MGDHAEDTLFYGETDAWWSPPHKPLTCKWCGKTVRWERRAGKWIMFNGTKSHRCDEYLKAVINLVRSS